MFNPNHVVRVEYPRINHMKAGERLITPKPCDLENRYGPLGLTEDDEAEVNLFRDNFDILAFNTCTTAISDRHECFIPSDSPQGDVVRLTEGMG